MKNKIEILKKEIGDLRIKKSNINYEINIRLKKLEKYEQRT